VEVRNNCLLSTLGRNIGMIDSVMDLCLSASSNTETPLEAKVGVEDGSGFNHVNVLVRSRSASLKSICVNSMLRALP